jgi:branched-chain amino acid transport system substrate-binding protein
MAGYFLNSIGDRRNRWRVVAGSLVVALLLAGCAGGAPPTEDEPAPAAEEAPAEEAAPVEEEPIEEETAAAEEDEGPIIIGAVFNATGWMADYDQPPREAALLAIEDINAAGGILGREVQLIERDGETDPTKVREVTQELIDEGADAIIAPCDFDIGGPASQAAQGAGLIGVSTCATSPLYGSTILGDKQFTVGAWNNILAAAMAEYGYEELEWRTAYVVVDTSIDYTLSLGDYFGEHFTALGGEIVGEDTYVAGDEDFSAQIEAIQALEEEPDVLYVTGYSPYLGDILLAMREAGIETPLAGGDTYDDVNLFALLGPEYGSEIYMATHSWLRPEAGAEMARFIEMYEAEYGVLPLSSFIVVGWDTVKILAQAMEAAGTTDGAAVAAAMEEMEFDLLSGELSWSSAAEGHATQKSTAIVQLQEGRPSFLGWAKPENPPEP